MVNRIEIKYKTKLIILDKKSQKFLINGIQKEFNETKFDKLLNYMSLWKNEYINNEIIDGMNIIIDIYMDKKKERILIKNEFPSNFQDFLNIMGDL